MPSALAAFYSQLLGWSRRPSRSPARSSLRRPKARSYVVFQQAADYERPVWPPQDGRQRPMMHFDFQVADLDAAVAEAVALGATVADHQPQQNVRVLFDPAGHPFCLCLDRSERAGTAPVVSCRYLSGQVLIGSVPFRSRSIHSTPWVSSRSVSPCSPNSNVCRSTA